MRTSNLPSSQHTIQTIDTTKLAGQLSVVQELPEVSKLVFQEVKQEGGDSIASMLEKMKEEDTGCVSPLDYTISSPETPLNLVNNSSKGVKRIMTTSHQILDTKRLKNVVVLQGENGEQILHHLPVSSLNGYNHLTTIKSVDSLSDLSSTLYLDPPSPKSENRCKNSSLKMSYSTKTVAGTVIPSSKTCNWVFENGQVCGKTFSKSYNLVVHMRMHEDIRPFACTLCDQTFRQKAHLQRHETTHGIQSKNFYRNPPGGGRRRKRGSPKMSKGLQERLSGVSPGYRKKIGGEDSEGEELMEDEEDDMYVPNGNPSKRTAIGRKYSNPDSQDEDREQDSDSALYAGGKDEPMHAGSSQERRNNNTKEKFQVGSDGEMMSALNLAQRSDDDDTSTVQDILHTVNSVPTLEQKLESSYLNCDSLLVKTSRNSSLPHITRLVDPSSLTSISLSNNNSLSTTLSQHLPGASLAQTNILYTTLSGSGNSKLLSLMEQNQNKNQLVIENLEEHSPEIQAELLNALLADETYNQEEVCQEEVYRLNTLPASWWVLRRQKQGSLSPDITYYSPQGFGFKTRAEIQNFLQNNLISRETKMAGLRQPPIPIESIPVLDDDLPSMQQASLVSQLDANSIAQVLIANLKPEPIESIQDALSETRSIQDSLSGPGTPAEPLDAIS